VKGTQTDRHTTLRATSVAIGLYARHAMGTNNSIYLRIETRPSVKGTDGYPHMLILRPLAAHRFVRFWASWGAEFPKMCHSLPKTPMNHRAKFDAVSFMLAGEIRNRTNKKHTRTVNDISTPCLSACVDIKL